MSPQQLDGARGTPLDDIYSVGATLYELLTSKPPFIPETLTADSRKNSSAHGLPPRRTRLVGGEPIDPFGRSGGRLLEKDPALAAVALDILTLLTAPAAKTASRFGSWLQFPSTRRRSKLNTKQKRARQLRHEDSSAN